jgi:predicted nucleic acid-binding protein
MKQRVILDAGPLVALLNRKDDYHDWVVFLIPNLQPPVLTCEAVITEACFLSRRQIGGINAILNLVPNGFITVSFQLSSKIATINKLVAKYADVPMSFADVCLVRMSEQQPKRAILTLDSDFRIYRKQGNQPIPVDCH